MPLTTSMTSWLTVVIHGRKAAASQGLSACGTLGMSLVSCRSKFGKNDPKPPRIRVGKGFYIGKGPQLLATKNLAAMNVPSTKLSDGSLFYAINPNVKPLNSIMDDASSVPEASLAAGSLELLKTPYLPPLTRAPKKKVYSVPIMKYRHEIPQKDVEEMRRLRIENPFEWTLSKLSQKFGLSEYQVSLLAPLRDEAKNVKEAIDAAYLEAAPFKYQRRKFLRAKLAVKRQQDFHDFNY